MIVTDLYLVRFLVQATQDAAHPLLWHGADSSEYRTELNGVRLALFHAHSPDGSHLRLRLSKGDDRTFLEEPRSLAEFGPRYRNDEERALAESLQALAECVATQCARPRTRARDLRDSIRESLYNRLLFGKP